MKKVMIMMTVLMGFTMSLVLSLVGTVSGGHFSVPGWLISFGISFVISLVIGFIVPVKKLGDGFCGKLNTQPESMKGNFLSAIISDLIYTPIITVAMVLIMVGNAIKHLPPEAAKPPVGFILVKSLIICLVVGYVVIVIIQPIFIKLLTKNMKKPEA